MSMIAEPIEQGPGSDIIQAVSNLGSKIGTAEEITGLRLPGNRHACYRLQLTDGRTVKGRRFKSAEKRESVTALYPPLSGLPFSRMLSVHGAATIEEWVHGSRLEPAEMSTELVRDLATLLATLHSGEIPPEISQPKMPDMDWYADRMKKQLALLTDRGHIDSKTVKQVSDRAMASGATRLENGIIHTDFHPRNMVTNPNGEVWVIDNEGIRLGALDYDIARCWRQWPMTRAQRDAFLAAYSGFRSLDSFGSHQEFWSICTLVHSARIQMRHRRPIRSFMQRLERITRRAGAALWPEPS